MMIYQLTNPRHQFCFPAFDGFIDFGALAAVTPKILSSKTGNICMKELM